MDPYLKTKQTQGFNTDFSSATGTSAPGDPSARNGTGGGANGLNSGASNPNINSSAFANQPNITTSGDWFGNLGTSGVNTIAASPGAFWRAYANNVLGLPGFSSSEGFLQNTFKNPAGLMMALGGNNTSQMQSTKGQLAAQTALGNILGGPAKFFDPAQLIKTTLDEVAQYDPMKGSSGPGGQLGMQLYSDDPTTMGQNILSFLGQILQGIVPDQVLNGIMNAITVSVDDASAASLKQGPGGGPGVDSTQIPMMIEQQLHKFGVI